MKEIRCAVIGVGYIGKYHAEKYAKLPDVDLVAVIDNDLNRAKEVAKKLGCATFDSYHQLLGKVDAVSIATPTTFHFEVAKFCLENNIHVLVEKPITTTTHEADVLIQLAGTHNLILQVGHLERFNSSVLALSNILNDGPKFFEFYRIAPFSKRSTDINVILDLMIHDIDLIKYLAEAYIASVVANGAPILSKSIDIANARVTFTNGTVANITASRAGTKEERSVRIFQRDTYISADLKDGVCAVFRKVGVNEHDGMPKIEREKLKFPKGDAIKAEIIAFLDAIRHHKPSPVSGESGRAALEISEYITKTIREGYDYFND
ncbi:MAG: Gfo/Idh/MocA family oxidoreductase [Pseudomonadota bacterium]